MFEIACGYADCNDAARLSEDPIQKLLLERDPVIGQALASQATLSRFENAVGPKALYRMGVALDETVIDRQRRRPCGKAKRITIELDPTDDPTHGAQQSTLFNGHYDTWCYLPVAGFVQFDTEPEQYLFAYNSGRRSHSARARASRSNCVEMMQLGAMSGSKSRRETEIFTEHRAIDHSKHWRYSAG